VKKLFNAARNVRGTTADPVNLSSKLGLSIDEAAHASGVSRSTLYGLIKAGRLHVTKVGRRTIVPVSAIRDLLGVNG
jgi:excisionase family DNA binding protein